MIEPSELGMCLTRPSYNSGSVVNDPIILLQRVDLYSTFNSRLTDCKAA
jgi:hypothetical protein